MSSYEKYYFGINVYTFTFQVGHMVMHSIAEYTNKTHEIVDLTRICEVGFLQAYNRIFQRLIFGTMTDLPILLQ